MKPKPRAYTVEESREMFLSAVQSLVRYWENQEGNKAFGMAHSILCIIDGVSGSFPCGFDLVVRTHPDDQKFHEQEGEDWLEDEMVINSDCHLHDQLYTP